MNTLFRKFLIQVLYTDQLGAESWRELSFRQDKKSALELAKETASHDPVEHSYTRVRVMDARKSEMIEIFNKPLVDPKGKAKAREVSAKYKKASLIYWQASLAPTVEERLALQLEAQMVVATIQW